MIQQMAFVKRIVAAGEFHRAAAVLFEEIGNRSG